MYSILDLWINIHQRDKQFFWIAFVVSQILFNHVQAITAYPMATKYVLSDGTVVSIHLKGDENFKWAVSEDDYTLVFNKEGKWAYAIKDSLNRVVPSMWQLTAIEKRSASLTKVLLSTPKNLKPVAGIELKNEILHQQQARSVLAKEPIVGTRKALVILMNFKDVQFTKDKTAFDALFNQIGYIDDGAQGSIRDYYLESSYGQLDLSSDIVGPFTAGYNMSYYGGNGLKGGSDSNPEELFREAIQAASNEINFSDYDADKDGCVDNIHIIFAGYGEEAGASSSAIWSHESSLHGDITLQDMKINTYSCAPELRGNSGNGISRIGVHCHEMGHALGAMDFYDTDGSKAGEYEGTGQWDIMASGSWNGDGVLPPNFNPYIRAYTFGWMEAITPVESEDIYPVSLRCNEIYRLDTSTPGEFFLIENRQQNGFDLALPGHGLMVYHIHSEIETELETNSLNTSNPQMCYPVCASSSFGVPSSSPSSYGDINSPGCPFPGTGKKSSFTDQTIPSAHCWNGDDSNIALNEIIENDSGEILLNIGNNQSEDNSHLVFAENFESGVFSPVHWGQTQIKDLQGWKICSPSDYNNEYTTSPIGGFLAIPINGDHYMYLRNSGLKTGSIIASVILKNIGIYNGQTGVLSFKYQNINKSKMTSSSVLKIYGQKNEYDNKVLLVTLSDNKTEWSSCIIDLPAMSETGRIIFEGTVLMGDIYVDEVKIHESSVLTQALPVTTDAPLLRYWNYDGGIGVSVQIAQSLEVFTIEGKLYRKFSIQSGDNRIQLPHGFYIFSLKDFRFKVVVN